MLAKKTLYWLIFTILFITSILVEDRYFGASPVDLKSAWGVLGIFIVLFVWSVEGFYKGSLKIYKSSLYLPIFLFLFWSFITIFWSNDFHRFYGVTLNYLFYACTFFAAYNLILNKNDFIFVLNIVIFSMIIIVFVAFVDYYFPQFSNITNILYKADILSSTHGNKNQLAQFVIMVFPVAFILFVFTKSKANEALYIFGIFFGFWFILFSASRQAYLALFVEVFILLLFITFDYYKQRRDSLFLNIFNSKRKGILFFITSIVIIGLINFNLIGDRQTIDISSRIQDINLESGNSRLLMWRNTLDMVNDNLVAGVGSGQWHVIYPKYANSSVQDVFFNEKKRALSVHNDYLEIFASVGVIGFLLLLWFLFLISKRIWLNLSNPSNENRAINLSIVLGLIGFSIVSIFSFPLRSVIPAFVFMLFVAIIMRGSKGKNIFIIKRTLTSSIVLLLLTSLYFTFNTQFEKLVAKDYYAKAVYFLNKNNNNAVYSNLLSAISLDDDVWEYYQMMGYYFNINLDYDSAIPYLNKALKISPYNSLVLINLAIAYNNTGNIKMEREVLNSILRFDKKNVQALSMLVRLMYTSNNYNDINSVYKKLKKSFEFYKNVKNFGPYHSMLAEIALLVGDYKYFAYIYDDLLSKTPKAEDYIVYGIIEYQRVGNKSKAKELFNKALKLDKSIEIPEEIAKDLEL